MPPEISLDHIEDQAEPMPTLGAAGTQPPPPSAPDREAEESVADEPAAEAAPVSEQKAAVAEDLVCGMPRAEWIAKNRRASKHAEAVRLEELSRRHPEVKALMDDHKRLVAELNKLRP